MIGFDPPGNSCRLRRVKAARIVNVPNLIPMTAKCLLPLATLALLAVTLAAQEPASEFVGLARIRSDLKSRRVGSYDRTGGNADNVSHVPDGARVDIMNVKGAGIITQ